MKNKKVDRKPLSEKQIKDMVKKSEQNKKIKWEDAKRQMKAWK